MRVQHPYGKVLPAVRDVLKICAEQKLVVQTGHLSPTEALAVIEAGRDAGATRMVVTQAQFEVVNMSFEQMKKAASMGATEVRTKKKPSEGSAIPSCQSSCVSV
jgi:hypothetical protein